MPLVQARGQLSFDNKTSMSNFFVVNTHTPNIFSGPLLTTLSFNYGPTTRHRTFQQFSMFSTTKISRILQFK